MMHLPSFTRWSPLLLGGILFLFTVAIYLPGTGSGFIWDDDDYLLDNTNLRTAAGLQRIWLQPRSSDVVAHFGAPRITKFGRVKRSAPECFRV